MMSAVHIGLPLFHVTVSQNVGGGMLSAGASLNSPETGSLTTFFRDCPLVGGVDGALAAVVSQFESFAGRFAGNKDTEGEFSLGDLVGAVGPILRRRGLFIRLSDGSGGEFRFGSESVIVLEVVMALADQLASWSPDQELVMAWSNTRARCDLLPMPRETNFEGLGTDTIWAEAEWYSARLGQSSDYYVEAARWLRARQMLYAFGRMPIEPTQREYRLDIVMDLPAREEVDVLVAEAAESCEQEIEAFVAEAVMDRNISARQEVVYRRWYGDPASRRIRTRPPLDETGFGSHPSFQEETSWPGPARHMEH